MNAPYIYKVKKVVKTVDGDTIDAEIDLGFDLALSKRVRLSGIDTPESRTKDLKEKQYGLEAKDWLDKRLKEAEEILIKTERDEDEEKYGRVLGELFVNGEGTSLNEQMVRQGYAWKYDGGTKKKDFAALDAARKASKA